MESVLCLAGFSICILIALHLNRRSLTNTLIRKIAWNVVSALSILLLAGLLFAPVEATTITEYSIPGNPGLWDLSVNATGTCVYFTESASNNVGYLFPGNASVRQIPVPTANSHPWGITFVPWAHSPRNVGAVFTESYGGKIGVMLSNVTNRIVEYEVWPQGVGLRKIVYDKLRDCVWFTEYSTGKLGSFSFAASGWEGRFSELQLSGAGDSNPIGIAMGTNLTAPAANQPYVWVADFSRRSIVRVHPEIAACREYSVYPFAPWDLAVDPDGIVWFTAQQPLTDVNVIGRLDPVAYNLLNNKWSLTLFSIPTPNCQVRDIEIDSYGNLWFTESSDIANKIGKYSPLKNVFTEYTILTPNSKPQGLAIFQSAGVTNVWFTEFGGRRIGRIRQPEGPTVSTTVSTPTYAVTTSSTATILTRTLATSASTRAYTNTIQAATTATNTSVTTTSSTVADRVTIVLTSSTYWSIAYTSTTSTSFTTSTLTYTTTSTSVEPTSTTTTVTGTIVSTTWQSFTVLTTVTYQSTSWFSETTSTTVTVTQSSIIPSPTVTVPTTTTVGGLTTVYSPTVTMTSTTYTGTTTTTTSTVQVTSTTYSPTATVTSTTTTMTTVMPLGVIRPCIIASAAYGSELATPVQFLREFRNEEVLSTFAGSQFMKAFNMFYYSFSPSVASIVLQSPALAQVVRALIYPLVESLEASSSIFRAFEFAPELGIVLAGIFGSVVLGIVYLTPTVIAIRFLSRRIRLKRCGLRANSGMMGSKAR